MKCPIEEYREELRKIREITCSGEAIDEYMRPFLEKLHDGLEVGDGVTINFYSDSHACTVTKRTPKTLTCRRDRAIRTDHNGMSDCQSYRYERDENGATYKAYWSKKFGCFCWCGKPISVGRHEYYDYSF